MAPSLCALFFLLVCMSQSPIHAHVFNLASNMPAHLSIMFSMSWFGIPSSDPQGGGADPGWGNWEWGGGCIALNDPTQCNTDMTSSEQRWIASKRRPLAGIYSVSGRTTESLRRIDLMLSNLVRPNCNDDAKLDAWSVQMDSIKFSSRYPSNSQCLSCDLAYRALLSFLSEAENNGMTNVIIPGMDGTWYYNFCTDFGCGKCDGSSGNPVSNCLDNIQSDLQDMITIAGQYTSAYRINGLPVVYVYLDTSLYTASDWVTILNNVRTNTGQDFYAIAGASDASFFAAFDAIAPWVNLGWYNDVISATTNTAPYAEDYQWVKDEHAALLSGVGNYPGCVVFGGLAPGFDDYTENWGSCTPREIPRTPTVINATVDYLKSQGIKGVILETWDDWTEGTCIEPDVVGGPALLLQIRQQLAYLFGLPQDPVGDQALVDKWNNFGQARNCNGGNSIVLPPQVQLSCPAPTTATTGVQTTAPQTTGVQTTGVQTTGVQSTTGAQGTTGSSNTSASGNASAAGVGGVQTTSSGSGSNGGMIAGIIIAVLVVLALAAAAAFYVIRKRSQEQRPRVASLREDEAGDTGMTDMTLTSAQRSESQQTLLSPGFSYAPSGGLPPSVRKPVNTQATASPTPPARPYSPPPVSRSASPPPVRPARDDQPAPSPPQSRPQPMRAMPPPPVARDTSPTPSRPTRLQDSSASPPPSRPARDVAVAPAVVRSPVRLASPPLSSSTASLATASSPTTLRRAPGQPFEIGAKIKAKYSGDGKFYDATVKEVSGSNYLVSYGPVFNNDEEWIPFSSAR